MEVTRQEFDALVHAVDEIRTAVVGCEELGTPGIVKRVGVLEKWKDSLTIRIATITGICVGGWTAVKYLLFEKH